MTELHLVYEPEQRPAQGHVIFVHGIGGDPFGTWRHDTDTENFWPGWLAEDVPYIAVHTLGYDASPTGWLGSTMPLTERAANVLTELQTRELTDAPVVFICHSIGGLLIKELLRHALEMQVDAWRGIADQTRAVIFLATPHRGSNLATIIGNVVLALGALGTIPRTSVTMNELQAKSPTLQDLNNWYINKSVKVGIATHCFYEKQSVKGVLVVDETSGRLELPGVEPIPIDAHHFSICKPSSREALVYRRIRQIVREVIGTKDPLKPSDMGRHRETDPEISGSLATASTRRPARIFLSYRRSAVPDHQLARALREGLVSAGVEVFIDTGIRVGTEWAREIEQRIIWCDYLIVLLSSDAVVSEMVVGEIRRAHHKRKRFLPIRVRYDDELDYELDSYLGRLQYAKWSGDSDTPTLVAELVAAVDSGGELPINFGERHDNMVAIRALPDGDRPRHTCDPRSLRAPGGTAGLRDLLYIARAPDEEIEAAAARTGETVVIKAPRQMGKSSLAVRYLESCMRNGKTRAYIDFQLLDEDEFETRRSLIRAVASRILSEFDLAIAEDDTLLTGDFTGFIERRVLEAIPGEVVIVFDEVDRIFGRPYQRDFFAMLRGWHNRRATHPDPWERLSLALVISTEPYLLINAGDQSPFNVVTPLQLEPLSCQQLGELNVLHGGVLEDSELNDIYKLVGGQPYLSRLAFYRLSVEPRLTFSQLVERAADPEGPFGEHLRSLLLRLQERSGLLDAIRQAVRHGTIPNDDTYHRLYRAGLIRREGNRVVPTNLLYARFFRDLR
jgi:pimeloyl-ACP methyl ester carboxylesterase